MLKLKDENKINKLVSQGHTFHCACRITWGDGECECNKSGITRKQQCEGLIKILRGQNVV